jgi:hypothetical protein
MVHKQQLRNGIFCTVHAESCTCNNGIHHAIAKQQAHCKEDWCFLCSPCQDVISKSVSEESSQWSEELVGELVNELTAGVQLLWEADSWGQGEFGNPEEGNCPLLEAITKRLVKAEQAEKI